MGGLPLLASHGSLFRSTEEALWASSPPPVGEFTLSGGLDKSFSSLVLSFLFEEGITNLLSSEICLQLGHAKR